MHTYIHNQVKMNLNFVSSQLPTAYISIGRNRKRNFNSPTRNEVKNIIYAIHDSKASTTNQNCGAALK